MAPQRRLTVLVIGALFAAVLSGTASAAPDPYLPRPNDDFADATVIDSVPWRGTASPLWASADPGEPASTCDGTADENSVWFSWTAPENMRVAVDTTRDDEFDRGQNSGALTVFTGDALGSLTEVGCSEQLTNERMNIADHRVVWNATAGTTYTIRVATFSGDPTPTPLNLHRITVPANDDFAAATPITTLPFQADGWAVDATLQGGEDDASCVTETASVWFSFTPETTGYYTLDAGYSSGAHAVVVWTGNALGSLTEQHCLTENDGPWFADANGNDVVLLTGGTPYRIQLAADATTPAERARFDLRVRPAPPPGNDDFADRTDVDALPFTDTVNLARASAEGSEPAACGEDASVWYEVTAPADGWLEVSTWGSSGDTEVGAYTGTTLGGLSLVHCEDDTGYRYQERALFDVSEGDVLQVQIANLTSGEFPTHTEVRIGMSDAAAAPANDTVGTAEEVDALPFRHDANTAGSTSSTTNCEPTYPEVFYEFTPPQNMRVFATTHGSITDTWLAVYDDPDVTDGANQLTCSDDYGFTYAAGAELDLTGGTTYYFAVGTLDEAPSEFGPVRFTLTGGGFVAGRVTSDATGDPLAGICVDVLDAAGTTVLGSATSDGGGDWNVAGLADGDVTVRVNGCASNDPSFGVEWYDDVPDGGSPDAVAIAQGEVAFTHVALNGRPVAADDAATGAVDRPVNVQVLDNDTDPDGDALQVSAETDGADGTVSCDTTTCTYTPDAGFTGTDTFTYTVSDGDLTADATVTVTVEPFTSARYEGADRIETAVAVSQATWPDTAGGTDAGAVVIARADEYPDALAGAPLAHALDAPILLTFGDTLDARAAAEIQRLDVATAYLLGGTAALSDQVRQDVAALGVTTIERLGGPERFSTAALVAAELADVTGGVSTAYVVEGANEDEARGWPDAVSAGPAAARTASPILLVTRDLLPDPTADAFDDLGITDAIVVGGTAAVSAGVETAVDDKLGAGDQVDRIAGSSRFTTSTMVADAELAALAGDRPLPVWLATGLKFPDALTAGPAVAASGGVLVLVADGAADVFTWLEDNQLAFDSLRIVGGTAAVSAAAAAQAQAAVTVE